MKIMTSDPIPSWQIDGKQWKQWQWRTLFSWAPKSLQMVTAAMNKRHFLLGRKAMTNLDKILKSRDITLPTKVHTVKAIVFPVFMCGCDSWTIRRAEHWRIDAFELWCWRRLLRVPWTARRSKSILKEINPEYSLEELVLKLKLQYVGHLMQRADSLEKTLKLVDSMQEEKVGGHQRPLTPTQWTWVWTSSRRWWRKRILVCCSPWGHKEAGKDWTTTKYPLMRNQKNALLLYYCFLIALYLCILSLISNCLNLPFRTAGKAGGWSLFLFFCFFKLDMPYDMWILVPWPGIEPTLLALKVQSWPLDQQGSPRNLLFYKQEMENMERLLYLGGSHKVLLSFTGIISEKNIYSRLYSIWLH